MKKLQKKVTKILKKLQQSYQNFEKIAQKSYQNFEKVATKVIYFLIYSFKIAIVKKTFFPGSNDHTIAVQFYSVMYNMTL